MNGREKPYRVHNPVQEHATNAHRNPSKHKTVPPAMPRAPLSQTPLRGEVCICAPTAAIQRNVLAQPRYVVAVCVVQMCKLRLGVAAIDCEQLGDALVLLRTLQRVDVVLRAQQQ